MIDNLLAMLKRPTRPAVTRKPPPSIKVPGYVPEAPHAALDAFAGMFQPAPAPPIKGVAHAER